MQTALTPRAVLGAIIGAVLAGLVAYTACPARADVDVIRGYFFVPRIDANVPAPAFGGSERMMEVERVYNSNSRFGGIFGLGWSSNLETSIKVMDDGTLTLQEYQYGKGITNKYRFSPDPSMVHSHDDIINELVNVEVKAGELQSPKDEAAYRSYLELNHQSVWEQDRANNLVSPNPQPVGETFTSARYQQIVKTATGYERRYESTIEEYDDDGRLVYAAAERNSIAFQYDAVDGRLSQISDYAGNKFHFTFTPDGHVSQIVDQRGRVATYRYRYDKNQNVWLLVFSKNADGKAYRYEYDRDAHLTAIDYADTPSMIVKYDGPNGSVSSVATPTGKAAHYRYQFKPTSNGQTDELITVTYTVGEKPTSSATAEYVTDPDDTVRRFTNTDDGKITEDTYDAAGMLLSEKEGANLTNISYDSEERITSAQEETASYRAEISYDPDIGFPTHVTITNLKGSGGSSPAANIADYHYYYDDRQ